MDLHRKLLIATIATGMLSYVATANAGVIYNNLPPVTISGGTDPFAVDGPSFNSFSTGSSVLVLTDVKMMLSGTPGVAHFTVSLLSDSSNSPGSFLATLGTFSDGTLAASASVYDVAVAAYALAAGTRYWFELNTAPSGPTSSVAWDYATNASGIGVSGEYWAYNPSGMLTVTANSNNSGPYQMEVTTTVSSAVPEPGTVYQILSALGIGISAMARRRME